MIISHVTQRSPEWHELKKGKIGGTRFGQVISGKKNRLIYELLDERMSDFCMPDQFIDENMQFGIDNEHIAAKLYSKTIKIRFGEVGAILSDHSKIHLASPDRINQRRGIVLEVKCTPNGYIHIQRFFEGVDTGHMPQIINYFAVSDDIKAVHWISYCPYHPTRPIVPYIFTPDSIIKDGKATTTIREQVQDGRNKIKQIEAELDIMEQKFKF